MIYTLKAVLFITEAIIIHQITCLNSKFAVTVFSLGLYNI